ncbi:MAG: hypothetical protein HQM08_07980 [Candidatus Riflebacteria bacterium]|nr:hypothetical protein [Candidatus Riflebacteria bacterium]
MLLIRCAACKTKLWKYEKIGHGEVLVCHKKRITRIFNLQVSGENIVCTCGKIVGVDNPTFIKMIQNAFVYSGTKSKG